MPFQSISHEKNSDQSTITNLATQNHDSETHNSQQSETPRTHLTPYVPIIPVVEWIYPDSSNTRGGNGRDTEALSSGTNDVECSERDSADFVLDTSQAVVIPTIDGKVVHEKICFLKIFGLTFFDDDFPFYTSPKLLLILFLFFISSIIGGILVAVTRVKNSPSDAISNLPSFSPLIYLSEAYDHGIGKVIFDLSGPVILEKSSPQHQALAWILDEDKMNLTDTSVNLLQRYSLMVMFCTLSGQGWTFKYGYGSDQHECSWFGVRCGYNQKVKYIDLSQNNLKGPLPKEIGFFLDVVSIKLAENQITGTLPTELGSLTRLQIIDTSGNLFSGEIPDAMRSCKNIERIDFAGNKIFGTIPVFLEDMKFLTSITLARNQLTGTVPPNLSKLLFLESLIFYDNGLTGTIPPELGSYQFLEILKLDKNSLHGTIPISLGNLSRLKFLYLDQNILTGVVPQELGELSSLEVLSMSKNHFSGNIPDSLGLLSKLYTLNLSDNMLNGTIPSSFDNLHMLNLIKLHGNMITGTVPQEICGFSLIVFTADCVDKDLKVSCSCCTTCF